MQKNNNIKNIYLLAMCGTAMASLAAMLKASGYNVYGSDADVYPPMSTFLKEQQIPIFNGFDTKNLDPRPDLVIVGNAISRGNIEIEKILDEKIPYISLPQALSTFFIEGKESIVVTGTHGKTTTTSLLAWIFDYAKQQPGFMIGGIPNNFNRGFQVGSGNHFIIEGDEYDSAYFDKTAKFLKYKPTVGIINSIEFDHADIYDSIDEIKKAFKQFINLVPSNGLLSINDHDDNAGELAQNAFCKVETFGLNKSADWFADDISLSENGTTFTVLYKNEKQGTIDVSLLGEHNIRNVLAAISVASFYGIEFDTIVGSLEQFSGIKKRLDYKGTVSGVTIYDDFGHHPTAISETLQGLKIRHKDRKIWALYEPRSATTRRNIFQEEFASAFANADAVLVAPIHRPDKAPQEKLFSREKLVQDLTVAGKTAKSFDTIDDIAIYLQNNWANGDIVVTFSNGPFGGIHAKLLSI